jgi:carbonic anhydrase
MACLALSGSYLLGHIASDDVEPKVKTPKEALDLLKKGNVAFYSAENSRTQISAYERRTLIGSQAPHTAILSCSDSRVPPELIFDQGPGDLFIVRIAGNAADSSTLGSLDYAVEHLHSRLILVMGHESCGAVKASMMPAADQAKLSPFIRHFIDLVSPATKDMPNIRDEKAKMREATMRNIRYQVAEVMKNPIIKKAVEKGQIQVVGGMYEIGSGAVEFLDTPEELKLD